MTVVTVQPPQPIIDNDYTLADICEMNPRWLITPVPTKARRCRTGLVESATLTCNVCGAKQGEQCRKATP